VKHFTTSDFWDLYEKLPVNIQQIADRAYDLLKTNPLHPSLHFKKIGEFRSVRIGLHFRAPGFEVNDGILWFWIGSHSEYDRLIR
jgi:hypothetical protein